MNLEMEYIKGSIDYLSHSLDILWDSHCKLERAVEDLTERVSETHGMVIHDEPQVQQTTEEFVRVVRCKDCKWYIKDTTDPYIFDCCNEDGLFHPSDDDYCSEGEKK